MTTLEWQRDLELRAELATAKSRVDFYFIPVGVPSEPKVLAKCHHFRIAFVFLLIGGFSGGVLAYWLQLWR